MKIKLIFVILLLLLSSILLAQQGELSLHFFGSASLPHGDFGKDIASSTKVTKNSGFDIGDKIGLAQAGFGAGAELMAPVWFDGLQWIISSRVLINGVNGEEVQSKFRSQFVADTVIYKYEGRVVDGVDIEFGNWINIPVMTGFRYNHHFSHKYTLYGILQAGMNIAKAPSKKATVGLVPLDDNKEAITAEKETVIAEDTHFKFARDFGFEAGLGFVFNQKYNLGFRYLFLSTPRFDGKRTLDVKPFPEIWKLESEIVGEERSVSMFVVTFGIQLFQ